MNDAERMLRVYDCVVEGHDLRLVLLAVSICLVACFSAFGLLNRVRHPGAERARPGWLVAAALVTGSGVWATHFVAMLAYRPSFPLGYDVATTVLSIGIAIALMLLGFAVALLGARWTLLGGAIVGAAIGAMHFVGMAAIEVQAELLWRRDFVAAALTIAIGFGALAVRAGTHATGLRRRILAAALLAVGICGLHFTAMAAARFIPDPRLDLPDVVAAPEWLAAAVTAITLMIVAMGGLGAFFDRYLGKRDESEAARLRAHVQELEATKRDLEATTAHLEASLAEAAAGSEAKSQFLATMSHELRTPLNAIIGFAELLAGEAFGPLGNPRYRQYAEDIHRSGTHLLGVINDVLDLSKLNAGRLALEEDEIEVGAAVGEAAQMMRVQAASAGLRLVETVEPELPLLRVDPRRLRQILVNLLSNAVKFTPSGGEVRLDAARLGDGVAIVVADTGIGIDPADIPRALERFGQVDGRLARKHEGTGLGLPLSKSLMELHGGRLEIESAGAGAGTRVTLAFPAFRLRVVEDLCAA
jgi:signal transduction histidine kinase